LDDGSKKLKPTYDALDGMFDYNVLRCVQAALLPGWFFLPLFLFFL
jgi:hypothetical protein